jgi:hypothetical protein
MWNFWAKLFTFLESLPSTLINLEFFVAWMEYANASAIEPGPIIPQLI